MNSIVNPANLSVKAQKILPELLSLPESERSMLIDVLNQQAMTKEPIKSDNILDMLAMPEVANIDIDFPKMQFSSNTVEFD